MFEKPGEIRVDNKIQKMCGRRKGAGELMIHTGTSVPLGAFEEIEMLAGERNMKIAKVLRKLLLRGLAAYHRDGLLEEPAELQGM